MNTKRKIVGSKPGVNTMNKATKRKPAKAVGTGKTKKTTKLRRPVYLLALEFNMSDHDEFKIFSFYDDAEKTAKAAINEREVDEYYIRYACILEMKEGEASVCDYDCMWDYKTDRSTGKAA